MLHSIAGKFLKCAYGALTDLFVCVKYLCAYGALTDLFVCVKYTNKLSGAVARKTVVELTSSLA